jgi:HEXXH motif-containing protein
MAIELEFAPNADRAREINARMHRELADSLDHVCEACRGELAFDQPAMDRLITSLREGANFGPGVFARYYELVTAIGAQESGSAIRLFAELAQSRPTPSALEVLALGGAELGDESARYQRMMNADPGVDLGFLPPSPQLAADFKGRLAEGLALLDRSLPELSGEIRAIVRHIVIAANDPSKAYQFDGGSHYQLWGALFLNGCYHPDPVAVVEVLAHESAHSLLFGFCTDEALVENDDDELYPSPLRVDERPMDGIYHATFVAARMHWAMSHLARHESLSREEREQACAAAEADVRNFAAGYGIVAEHGRLTKVGRGLMSSAKAYMDAAA